MNRHAEHGDLSALPILGGSYQLAIGGLTLQADSFTLRYTVTPPLSASVLLTLDAEDDLGNTYVDWGGAYGTSPDGLRTQGTITARPAPPPSARHLRVRLVFLRSGAEFPYDLVLPLP
ncbi:hypothetical protein [Streptomyces erythrochromogenes]|uniref:hypothetical protein n=1 Tax=Streptomyces erythrochromogenes TaxID=285574 RepID=UPI0038180742